MPIPVIRRARESGFTLLELLVVLILSGMVAGILLQALQHVLRLEEHFGKELFSTQQGQMYEDWYRRSVQGLVPDHLDGGNRFRGSAREFRGLTLAPLSSANVSLLPFAWRLQFDRESGRTLLQHLGDGEPTAVLSWTGNSGRFLYVDREGGVHETWPPAMGKWPQLPFAIHVESANAQDPRVIVAAPRGLADPLPRFKDFMD